MVGKLITIEREQEKIWLDFAVWCKINKTRTGTKIIDLIEKFLKKSGKK